MIEALPVLTAVATGAVGFVAGRWRRRGRVPKVPASPQPICACTHPLSSHDPETGTCNDHLKLPSSQTMGSHWVDCPCLQYVGPRPAQEFFTTDIAWDSDVMRRPPEDQ